MTENRRITLNIVATYGRSLFALVCGLFTSRWVLMALGQSDYGLYGVVGGLTAFIAFFNGLMAGAVGRFYAFSVGQAKVAGIQGEGLEVCRQWFNTAVLIHTVVPLALIIIGYPVGMWAVESFLTIPPERVEACRWVFRFVCISCFVGMMNVPFQAMYTAKQYIAELTIYSFVTTTLNVCFLYFMVTHPGDWLAKYALWTCLLSIVPQLLICLRALKVFPECRFNGAYLWDWRRTKTLVSFAGWQFFGNFGYLIKAQGIAILVNKFFGPAYNATMGIANAVTAQTGTLTAAMNGAFTPAITTMAGASLHQRMLAMTYRACKFGTLACLLFALPLSLELDYLLRLWLKTPPPFLTEVTWLTLATLVVDETTRGVGVAVTAQGRIAKYYVLLGTMNVLTLPLGWVWLALGGSFIMVFEVILGIRIVAVCSSIWIARPLIGVSMWSWIRRIVVPLTVTSGVTLIVGEVPRSLMSEGICRVVVVCGLSGMMFLAMVWCIVLDEVERETVLSRLRLGFDWFRGR